MFSYYGSKSKIAHLYPAPEYKTIIEPFAGAGHYSFYHRKEHTIWLNEKYGILYDIWNWLIHEATQEEILAYRDFRAGENISQLKIHPAHKQLIGFCINRGSIAPKNIVQKWCCNNFEKPDWANSVYAALTKISSYLNDIRHWKISFGDYTEIPNQEVTWFIDPPYQYGGEHYTINGIDYQKLKQWCLTRKGQIIVCENSKADWLPFKPLKTFHGQIHTTVESLFTNSFDGKEL